MNQETALSIFEGKKIRKIWHNEEWWFSIIDIAYALTGTENPNRYWSDLKIKLNQEGSQLYDFIVQLKLLSSDNKRYETDCTNTEGAFRIIQSIPSPKAEPFKLWLAKTGYERIQEIENPELAQDRAKGYYELKGYPKEWINKRLRGIAIRQELTDEWKERGVKQETDFAILTNEITKATFGKTVKEYKEFKGLEKKNQNLRDHMNDLELIFTMLGEKATTEITKTRNDKEFPQLKSSAKRGGEIASHAKQELETETGKSVTTKQNYLRLTQTKKLKNKKK
ncbi:MAG TPA: BRO family protein [archaeon]|nr:BRO family protein [archaeon]